MARAPSLRIMKEPSGKSNGPVDQSPESVLQDDERLKTLFDTIPHGIQENGIDGVITFSNPAHHRMLGYESGALIGKAIWDLLADDGEKEELRKYLAFLVKEKPPPTPYVARCLRDDGTSVDTKVDWNYRLDGEEKVAGFISVITDITEQKKIEERLKESETQFRSIVESAPMGIHMYRCDASGKLVFAGANPAADAILGVDNRQFVGKTIEETMLTVGRCLREA
jgi:PAS domain S-box-containing protein